MSKYLKVKDKEEIKQKNVRTHIFLVLSVEMCCKIWYSNRKYVRFGGGYGNQL